MNRKIQSLLASQPGPLQEILLAIIEDQDQKIQALTDELRQKTQLNLQAINALTDETAARLAPLELHKDDKYAATRAVVMRILNELREPDE